MWKKVLLLLDVASKMRLNYIVPMMLLYSLIPYNQSEESYCIIRSADDIAKCPSLSLINNSQL